MNRTLTRKRALTAADVTRRAPVIHYRSSLRAAARALARCRLPLLPVADDKGRFAGALAAAEVLRWALDAGPGDDAPAWTDWQLMAPGGGRADEVRWHLSADPPVVAADDALADIARVMGERRASHAVVLDGQRRPVGVVMAGDFLAAGAPARRPDLVDVR